MKSKTTYLKIGLIILAAAVPLSFWAQQYFKFIEIKPLEGAAVYAQPDSLSVSRWFEASYQEKTNGYLNENFGFRNWFVRGHNQLMYSLFEQTNTNGVVVGKNGYLFEDWYIQTEKGQDFIGNDSVFRQLNRVQQLTDTLNKLGKTLLIVLAPGKAHFYPEHIPDRFKVENDTTNYQCFSENSKKLSINLLDLQSHFLNEKESLPYPLYSKNGTHWSYYGMCLVADTLIRFIEEKHEVDMNNPIWSKIEQSLERSYDYDIATAMNLLSPMKKKMMGYPNIHFEIMDSLEKPKVLVVADSYYFGMFNFGIAQAFGNNRLRYYNKQILPDSYTKEISVNDVSLKKEIADNDVFVVISTDANLRRFSWGFIEDLYELYFP